MLGVVGGVVHDVHYEGEGPEQEVDAGVDEEEAELTLDGEAAEFEGSGGGGWIVGGALLRGLGENGFCDRAGGGEHAGD